MHILFNKKKYKNMIFFVTLEFQNTEVQKNTKKYKNLTSFVKKQAKELVFPCSFEEWPEFIASFISNLCGAREKKETFVKNCGNRLRIAYIDVPSCLQHDERSGRGLPGDSPEALDFFRRLGRVVGEGVGHGAGACGLATPWGADPCSGGEGSVAGPDRPLAAGFRRRRRYSTCGLTDFRSVVGGKLHRSAADPSVAVSQLKEPTLFVTHSCTCH